MNLMRRKSNYAVGNTTYKELITIENTKFFDITDFGAIGDAVTDSTEAIQKALDEASKCMGSVIVPPGK